MPEVIVQLHEATEPGRLYYERDPGTERHIVSIESSHRRVVIHSVVINGSFAVLMFDVDRVLTFADFGCNWNVCSKVPRLGMPRAVRAADLVLVNVEPASEWPPHTRLGHDGVLRHSCSFDTDVDTITDTEHSCVQFLFGATEPIGEWIALSHQCFALVNNDCLRGFFVRLADAPLKQYKTRQTR